MFTACKKYYTQASSSKSNLCDIIINNNINNNNNKSIFKAHNLVPRDYSKRAHTHTHTHCIYTYMYNTWDFFIKQSEHMGVNHSFNPSHLKKVNLYMLIICLISPFSFLHSSQQTHHIMIIIYFLLKTCWHRFKQSAFSPAQSQQNWPHGHRR